MSVLFTVFRRVFPSSVPLNSSQQGVSLSPVTQTLPVVPSDLDTEPTV